MTTIDCRVYEQVGRWHFSIFKLPTQRGAGASGEVFDSSSDNRRGHATKDDASKASQNYNQRPSLLLPHSV